MGKHYKIILIAGALLSLAVIFFLILAGDSRQAESELIDSLAEGIGAECSAYTLSKRYASVYGLCRQDNLRFRVDDLASSPPERIERFKTAMQASCHAGFDGRLLRIPVLENETMLVSAYFLADYRDYPDLSNLQKQLEAAGYQTVLRDICAAVQSLKEGGIKAAPTAFSNLSGLAERFASAEIQCDEKVFKLTSLGITGLICSAPEIPEAIAVNLDGKTRQLEDAIANGFDYMAYCPKELSIRLIRLERDIYIMAESAAISGLRDRLVTRGGYDNAEIVEFCSGIS